MNEQKTYPDFVVTAHGDVVSGANINAAVEGTGDNNGDVILVVIEIGSLKRPEADDTSVPPSATQKHNTVKQLRQYHHRIGRKGYRWKIKALGIAMLGTEFSTLESNNEGGWIGGQTWYSIYSEMFIQKLEEMVTV
jgi:hypothetical protein